MLNFVVFALLSMRVSADNLPSVQLLFKGCRDFREKALPGLSDKHWFYNEYELEFKFPDPGNPNQMVPLETSFFSRNFRLQCPSELDDGIMRGEDALITNRIHTPSGDWNLIARLTKLGFTFTVYRIWNAPGVRGFFGSTERAPAAAYAFERRENDFRLISTVRSGDWDYGDLKDVMRALNL